MKSNLRHLNLFLYLITIVLSLGLGLLPVFGSNSFSNKNEDDNQINALPFTVEGILSYEDRNESTSFGRNYLCRVMDYDNNSSDDLLWEGEAGRYGEYTSALIANFDNDGDDGNYLLDIYVLCRTRSTNLQQVVLHPTLRLPYGFSSQIAHDVSTSSVIRSIHVLNTDNRFPAMWIFEDMMRVYEYWDLFSGFDSAPVQIIWQNGINEYRGCLNTSCFISQTNSTYPVPEVFISDMRKTSKDTVVHELGHAYIYDLVGSLGTCDRPHSITLSSTLSCAWSEGWADFLPLFMNGDGCYDFELGPCSGYHIDLENACYLDLLTYFNHGEAVEGRVAGALYDLVDGNNESFDLVGLPLDLLVNILHSPPLETSFPVFWNNWIKAGNGYEMELDSIFFLNTVGKKIFLPLILEIR